MTPLFLHRVNVTGAVVALAVPAFGFATAVQLGVLTDAWLLTAIGLTAVAAAVFGWGVVRRQRQLLRTTGRYRVVYVALLRSTAVFTVLWMIVVTLMIFRPGSTAGVAG